MATAIKSGPEDLQSDQFAGMNITNRSLPNVNQLLDIQSHSNTELYMGVVICLLGLVMNIAACAAICKIR